MRRLPKLNIKLLSLAAVLLIAGILTGCKTVNVAQLEETEKAAVPVITVNKYIDMDDVTSKNSMENTLIQRILDSDNFDLTPTVNKLQNKVHNAYDERLPVDIMEEDQVITTNKYKNFELYDDEDTEEAFTKFGAILVPEGYKKYAVENQLKGKKVKFFNAVPSEADAVMFATAQYAMIEDTPFLVGLLPFGAKKAAIKATIKLHMMDEEGNTILRIEESGMSDNDILMAGGISVNSSKIQELSVAATDEAFAAVDRYTEEELKSGD